MIVALSKVKINQYYHVLFVQQAGTKLHQHNQFVQHVKKVSILLKTAAKQLTTHERTSVYHVNQVVHFQPLRLNVQYANRVSTNLKLRLHRQFVQHVKKVSILLQTTAKQLTTHERTSVYRVNQVVHFQLLRLNVQYVNRVGINLKSRMHQQVVLYAPQVFH